MHLSTALAFFEFNGNGLAILMLAPALVGITALLSSIALFAKARSDNISDGTRFALILIAVILLVLALGIGACFGSVMH
jgi:hypothetical protein